MINMHFISFILASFAIAGEMGQSNKGTPTASGTLPKCVDAPAEIEAIHAIMKANSKTAHKYDGYKKAFGSSSENEVLARLIYAETLAANCPSDTAKIAPVVAGVIKNRVTQKTNAFDVVFERDQFASSLNNYSESRYKDFLCPKDSALWKTVQAEVQRKDSILPANALNYYFFKHSTKFQPPAWAAGPKSQTPVALPISAGDKPCVRAYLK